jgi:hypothetical protein
MNSARRLVAMGLVLVLGAEARAQLRIGPPPPPVVVVAPGGAFGVGFSHGRRDLAISAFLGRSSFGYPGYFGPGSGFSSVRIINIYTGPPQLPPTIIINNNINVNPPEPAGGERGERGPDPLDDDRFMKIVPRQRKPDEGMAAAPRKPAPERVRPEAPAMPKKADKVPELPRKPAPERPADNPKEENARLVALAREAFAAGEFGRAERRLAQAIRAEPKEPLPYFLLAQAQLALGQFREAVDSIDDGTRRKANWPGERFRVRELYDDNEEEFDEHRKRLEETLERNPNDFFLLFLRGYQLWFDGKQNDARALFERAAKVAPEKYKAIVNRFLLHGMPIARAE